MQSVLVWIGRSSGILGLLLIILAVLRRVSGAYYIGGLQIGTVLQGGIATLLLGCLAYLVVLVECQRK